MADPKPTDQTPSDEERARQAAAREDEPAAQASRMHQEQQAREAEEAEH